MSRIEQIDIDLSNVMTSAQLHQTIAETLNFPDWYGCNWDAFWDAITKLVEMPNRLKLNEWSIFESRLPRDAKIMKECLDEMSRKYPTSASQVIFN